MRFRKFIDESLDSDVAAELIENEPTHKVWRATIGSRDIIFIAERNHKGYWHIEFGEVETNNKSVDRLLDIRYELTNRGNELKVFSMIRQCIMKLIELANPQVILFSADKSDKNRASAYERLVKRLNLADYHLTVDKDSHLISVAFRLEKVK